MKTDDPWSKRVDRAAELARDASPTQHLVAFYAALLAAQSEVYRAVAGAGSSLTGVLQRDLPAVKPALAPVLDAVAAAGPGDLAQRALALRDEPGDGLDLLLLSYWRSPSGIDFFGKACLQPYARCLADRGIPIPHASDAAAPNRCPVCAGRPQVASIEGGPASGGRTLHCARCLTSWSFKRVMCVECGEENPATLGCYRSPEYPHVRLDTCDICRHYVKAVDLTILGLADPLVDDVASAALDLWAVEQGYVKVERNLVGM